MQNRLKDRVALVTGASSGIGEATALALAEQGAKVAIAARRKDRLERLATKLAGLGAEPLVLVADLGNETEAQRIVRDTEAHYGRLDILINNAGVMYLEPVAEADLGRWRSMLELNVLSLIASTQAALGGMRARRDGHIVNVSSVAGRVANPNSAAYAATKFGVVGFSESLRREVYKDNIRVSVIEPGMVDTELSHRSRCNEAGGKCVCRTNAPAAIGGHRRYHLVLRNAARLHVHQRGDVAADGPRALSIGFFHLRRRRRLLYRAGVWRACDRIAVPANTSHTYSFGRRSGRSEAIAIPCRKSRPSGAVGAYARVGVLHADALRKDDCRGA